MKYVRSGDKIIVSLERGEELCGTLKMLAAEENIKFALVRAHGSCLRVTLGSYVGVQLGTFLFETFLCKSLTYDDLTCFQYFQKMTCRSIIKYAKYF